MLILVVDRAGHLVESSVLDGAVHHLDDGTHRPVVVDGAPRAWGPELQDVGDAGGLLGTGAHCDPKVGFVLQDFVQQAALCGHTVPAAQFRHQCSVWEDE